MRRHLSTHWCGFDGGSGGGPDREGGLARALIADLTDVWTLLQTGSGPQQSQQFMV
jgi:hypothetical protein